MNYGKGLTLRLFHLNVRSINNKILPLSVILNQEDPAIFLVSEHWLDKNEVEKLHLENYRIVSHSSRLTGRGGGTAIFMREGMTADPINTKLLPTDKHCEFSVIRCDCDVPYIIVCMYRSPVSDFNTFISILEKLLNELYRPGGYVVVGGDFNVNFAINSPQSLTLINLMESYGLVPHGSGMTRVSVATSTQIDNFFSNIPQPVTTFSACITDISDHYGQLLDIVITKANHHNLFIKKRFFTSENTNIFKQHLHNEAWMDILLVQSVNDKYNVFSNILLYYFNTSFPICSSRLKLPDEWINREIKQFATHIKDLYVNYQVTGSEQLLLVYKKEKKEYLKFLSNYKTALNDNKILNSQNKSKTMWDIFNRESNNKNHPANVSLKSENGCLVEDPSQVSDLFSAHFKIGIQNVNLPEPTVPKLVPTIFLEPTDHLEVYRVIMDLPNKFSSGLDEIPTYILKRIASDISGPLAHIINECFITGQFPDKLKAAKVVPIYKKGDKQDVKNYRPVSVLPSVSKVFERVIYERMITFVNRHNILSDNQFGFRQSKSTELAIFHSLTYIFDKVDKGFKVCGLYFDLSRAFDTLDHRLLLGKLQSYGFRGLCGELLSSYLAGRSQTVCVIKGGQKHFSKSTVLDRGVPQGSIIGPLLFILYVNDLYNLLGGASVCKYADDTSRLSASRHMSELSESCTNGANEMAEWCTNNSLQLNVHKTGLLSYSKREALESPLVRLGEKSVPVVNTINFLGMTLDSCLTWQEHIRKLTSKLNSICAIIRRLRNILSTNTLRVYYFAHVQSILNYGICFWGSSTDADRVFISQKRVLRCILGLHPSASCREHFSNFNIMTTPSLYFLSLVLLVKKNPELFIQNRDHYNPSMTTITRGRDDFSVPLHSSAFFKKSPYYRAICAYRLLPCSIRSVTSIKVFRKNVIEFVKSKCFYDFDFS